MKFKIGDIVLAKVTNIKEYGFFIKALDYDGLCHISEISNDYVDDINRFVKLDDEIYVEILDIDDEKKELKVSIKDIYYRGKDDDMHIAETRKGFLPLKKQLPIWIEKKMQEYK